VLTLERVITNYNKAPRDIAVGGRYASKPNVEQSIETVFVNDLFNKIVGSMKK